MANKVRKFIIDGVEHPVEDAEAVHSIQIEDLSPIVPTAGVLSIPRSVFPSLEIIEVTINNGVVTFTGYSQNYGQVISRNDLLTIISSYKINVAFLYEEDIYSLIAVDSSSDNVFSYANLKGSTLNVLTIDASNTELDVTISTQVLSGYTPPSGGIPATDLAGEIPKEKLDSRVQASLTRADSALQQHQDISGKVDKEQGKGLSTNDYTTAEKNKLASLSAQVQSDWEEDDPNDPAYIANKPSITTINGKSAYEIAVEEGFTGSKADWLASLIGSCSITGDGSNIIALIVNDLVTGGAGNILSAEMGKQLAQQILAGTGTYAEAFNKSKTFESFFPWLLDEVDDGGNRIHKMIWHIGNHEFIDAIGSVITGKKDGITIVSDGNGVLELYGGGYEGVIDRNPSTQPVGNPARLSFSAGETNFSFDDIKNAFISENQSLYETAVANTPNATPTTMDKIYTAIKNYDGKSLACSSADYTGNSRNSVFDVKVDSENDDKATYVDIDFGGVVINGATPYNGNSSDSGIVDIMNRYGLENSLLRDVKRLVVEGEKVKLFNRCHTLRNVQLSGFATSVFTGFDYLSPNIADVDLSNFEVKNTCSRVDLFSGAGGVKPVASIDIRKFDTSAVTSFNNMFGNCAYLKTIIIGNFSNASATAVDKFLVYANNPANPYSGVTLVCTSDTPPVLNSSYDWIANHFSTIRVPNKTVEVEGEDVTVLSIYQNAAGWSTYADIMETYEDSEY